MADANHLTPEDFYHFIDGGLEGYILRPATWAPSAQAKSRAVLTGHGQACPASKAKWLL